MSAELWKSPTPPSKHDRRKGRWTLKLLAAHFIYDRVSNAAGDGRSAGVCSAMMDCIMSMKTLGRLAAFWDIIAVPTLRDVLDERTWVPEELHEVAKGHLHQYVAAHSLDAAYTRLLLPYFEECFKKVAATCKFNFDRRSTPADSAEGEIVWENVALETLKELRRVTPEKASRSDGWVKVRDVLTAIGRKHPRVFGVGPEHFTAKIIELDGMMKVQELKGKDGTVYLRATYCHKDPGVAAAVLGSHASYGSAGAIESSAGALCEFIEDVRKPDPIREQYGRVKMVPYRPLLLFPAGRADNLRRRGNTDAAFAKVNKIGPGSAFLPCNPNKVGGLIVVNHAEGAVPVSLEASDTLEEVTQVYHVLLSHRLEEQSGGVVPAPTTARCHALLPTTFGAPVTHLFPVLTMPTDSVQREALPPRIVASPAAAPSHSGEAFSKEVDAIQQWINGGAIEESSCLHINDSLLCMTLVGGDKRLLSKIRGVISQCAEARNATDLDHTVVVYDTQSRSDILDRLPFVEARSLAIVIYRAPSAGACARWLAKYVLGNKFVPDTAAGGSTLMNALASVFHHSRYEILEFLGDGVGDYIAAQRKWTSPNEDLAANSYGADRASAAAIGQEVSQKMSNTELAAKLPSIVGEHLKWVLGRRMEKHFADAFEAIVGAFYLYGYELVAGGSQNLNGPAGGESAIGSGIHIASRFIALAEAERDSASAVV